MKRFRPRNLFSRQRIVLQLGAFALAIVLWVFVTSSDQYMMVMKIPMEVRNLSAQKALREEVPETARVRFRGSGRALFKASLLKNFYDDFKLVIDLDRISEEYRFYLNEYYQDYPQKVVIPPGFDIEFVEVVYPAEVHISLDDYQTKEVRVRQRLTIQPAAGYVLAGQPTVNPQRIKVAGPEELTESINFVRTVADTFYNVTSSINQTIDLEPSGRLLEYSQQTVNFTADIQAISERIVTEIPVQINNVLPGLRVFVNPRTVSLTIVGGVDLIAGITPEDIEVSIDFASQWDPKQQFYQPQVFMPEGVLEWQDLSPRNVELVVTRDVN